MANNASAEKAASHDPITRFAQSLISPGTTNADNQESNLFHGYYFRIVTEDSAAGTKGLRLVAYPAEYRSSGVMTFVVTRGGIVFEKDLGSSTTTVAPQMKARTGSGWRPAA